MHQSIFLARVLWVKKNQVSCLFPLHAIQKRIKGTPGERAIKRKNLGMTHHGGSEKSPGLGETIHLHGKQTFLSWGWSLTEKKGFCFVRESSRNYKIARSSAQGLCIYLSHPTASLLSGIVFLGNCRGRQGRKCTLTIPMLMQCLGCFLTRRCFHVEKQQICLRAEYFGENCLNT